MKREIKFRGWDKENGCWVSIDGIVLCDDGSIAYLLSEKDDMPPYSEDEVELMQFTGIRDKNGVEVYEGDIVRVSADGQSYVSVVLGPDGDYPAFDLDMKYIPDTWYYEANVLSTIASGEFEEMVVIGNVHEIPELLEASK